jgi:hypothetical protein
MPESGAVEFGFKQMDGVLRELPGFLRRRVFSGAVRAAANVLKKEMQRQAPYNPRRRKGTHLRDAITARKLRGSGDVYRVTASYGYPKAAPHHHLVVRGTGRRELKKPRLWRTPSGRFVRIIHTGRMRPNPYVYRAGQIAQQSVAAKFAEILQRGIIRTAERLAGRYRTSGLALTGAAKKRLLR